MVVAQKAFVTILVVKPHDFARRRILFTISISRERTSPPVKTITLISGYNEVHVFIKSAITFSSKEELTLGEQPKQQPAQARASFLSATASRPSPLDGRLAVVHEIFVALAEVAIAEETTIGTQGTGMRTA